MAKRSRKGFMVQVILEKCFMLPRGVTSSQNVGAALRAAISRFNLGSPLGQRLPFQGPRYLDRTSVHKRSYIKTVSPRSSSISHLSSRVESGDSAGLFNNALLMYGRAARLATV